MNQLQHLKELSHIFDSTHNGVSIIDETGTVIVYNRAAGMMLDKDPDEMLGRFIGDVFPTAWEDLEKILKNGIPQLGKKITLGNSTIVANRTPIFEDQQVVGAISVFQDISEYENIAHQLESYKKLNKQLNAIINSSFDGLWICDHEGKVIRVNKASERINDIKAEQVVGKRMETLIREGIIDRSVTLEVLNNRTGVTIIQNLKNGKQILVTGNPVFDDHGEISLVVVNERDITNLNKLRNELEESKALASRYRSELSLMDKQASRLSEAVIRSEIMHKVLNRSMKVAQVDSTVLIQGETGVGKGFFARLIHRASPRNEGPFIRVDCGAIPETLIESELFGYEKGAFTGARTEGKPGLFELAEGGTLFLDEIGDLPLTVQVKLLRFLEENSIMRVGGTSIRKVNARVIAATHRNLEKMVKKGEFRKDLFFRLNVVPIHIPPLRERIEDIPPLINFFLNDLNHKHSTEKTILPRAIDCLCQYPFSGNIRELSNLVERVVVLTQDQDIHMEDLPSHVRHPDTNADVWPGSDDSNLPNAVARTEKEMIIRALRDCGTQRKAARILGIDQSTLARKAKRYGIRNDAVMHQDAELH
ncbi:MAG: sigma 54-interacting transcriptional regulator [Desulfobacteraceae bacterium]|nr:sigma 54-interacting transcriptional regulator [Desulfobacteraceae bacterium]